MVWSKLVPIYESVPSGVVIDQLLFPPLQGLVIWVSLIVANIIADCFLIRPIQERQQRNHKQEGEDQLLQRLSEVASGGRGKPWNGCLQRQVRSPEKRSPNI